MVGEVGFTNRKASQSVFHGRTVKDMPGLFSLVRIGHKYAATP